MRSMGTPHGQYVRTCPACQGCKVWAHVFEEGATWRILNERCPYCAGMGYLVV